MSGYYEINPAHPMIEAVLTVFSRGSADARLEGYCQFLYDQALISEGSRVKDPLAFTRFVNDLLVKDASA